MFKTDSTNRYFVIAVAIIATLFLLVANFSFFYSQTIYNSTRFAEVTMKAFRYDEVRKIIAVQFLDQIFEGRPVVRRIAGETIEPAIVGMLESPVIDDALEKSIVVFHNVLTTKLVDDIVINLDPIKRFITPLLMVATNLTNKELGFNISEIPDEIVLIKGNKFPNYYAFNSFILWAGPVAGLLAIGTYAFLYLAFDKFRAFVLKYIGLSILIGSSTLIFFAWIYEPAITSSFNDANVRVIVGAIYREFSRILIGQTILLALIGGGVILWGKVIASKKEEKETVKKLLKSKK